MSDNFLDDPEAAEIPAETIQDNGSDDLSNGYSDQILQKGNSSR